MEIKNQSRKMSAVEGLTNTTVALIISTTVFYCLQAFWLLEMPPAAQDSFWMGFLITGIFTVLSIVRNYVIRSIFYRYDAIKQKRKHRIMEACVATSIIGVMTALLHSTIYQETLRDFVTTSSGAVGGWELLLGSFVLTLLVRFKGFAVVYAVRRYFNNLTIKTYEASQQMQPQMGVANER